ncbi:unnamed protein product [Sphagnum jensenii]|uniref:Uncharacterized protein n=1 Tax=Sphagnum jensenii TaxID=128206 RepID=A0ABP1BDS9_9BRYO
MRLVSKALVGSLRRDPAIWKAFVKNEKVQELMQSHNRELPQLEDNGEAFGIGYWQEETDPFDKMFKTCMALKTLVLALVVVKRGLVVT